MTVPSILSGKLSRFAVRHELDVKIIGILAARSALCPRVRGNLDVLRF